MSEHAGCEMNLELQNAPICRQDESHSRRYGSQGRNDPMRRGTSRKVAASNFADALGKFGAACQLVLNARCCRCCARMQKPLGRASQKGRNFPKVPGPAPGVRW